MNKTIVKKRKNPRKGQARKTLRFKIGDVVQFNSSYDAATEIGTVKNISKIFVQVYYISRKQTQATYPDNLKHYKKLPEEIINL